MKINVHKYGNGFPLVLFHGWGFDSKIWLTLVPKIMTDYQLILVDLPGFGHSPIMDWQFFKAALLKQLPQKFALMGWSMGGLYALRLALEESARVDFFISISSSPRFLLDGLWPGISHEIFHGFYKKISKDSQSTLSDFLELNGLGMGDKLDYLPDTPPSSEGLKLGLNILQTWDFREELKQFAQPSCFMFGRLDPIVPVKTMRYMQMEYPQFKYILFNRAAHIPFLSHLDLFIKEIREFIQ